MSDQANKLTLVLDRSVAVAFGLWKVDIGLFFQSNGINLTIPRETLLEFKNGERQQSLWSNIVPELNRQNSTTNSADDIPSATSSIFINPQGNLTTLGGTNTSPVEISSVTLPVGTSVHPDQYYLALASTLQSSTANVFICSDDKSIANTSATRNISHLWSMDVLCLMYDWTFVSGQKARRIYERISRIDSRHVPSQVKTFRRYYDERWTPKKRTLLPA